MISKRIAGLSLLGVLIGTTIWMAAPAEAKSPKPPTLPALTGTVKDACTGAKIANLNVSVEKPPGPPTAPSKVKPGTFKFTTLPDGDIRLQVSAPGYAPLGDAAQPGLDIARPPGPPNLPSPPQFAATGYVVKINLAPSPIPAGCVPRKPMKVNALDGNVKNSCNGGKIANMNVTLTKPPGPPVAPAKVATGSFKYVTAPDGTSRLKLSAPGFGFLGFAASPGMDIVRPPGPPTVPAPQSVAIGIKVKIQLGPSAGCLHVP